MTDARERIRRVALKLFAAKGFARTSIGAIEEAAGFAPRAGAFYRYFTSKEALLEELARSRISETPDEFDFASLLELADTRSELILIAQTYEKASRRQKPFLQLIEEVRRTQRGRECEDEINRDLFRALQNWVGTKLAAREMAPEEISALVVSIFGGWLFYITKVQQGVKADYIDRDVLLDRWATLWADILDGALRPETAPRLP